MSPFNTRETYPEQDLDNDLCQAVVAGNTVYLRGQIGQDRRAILAPLRQDDDESLSAGRFRPKP